MGDLETRRHAVEVLNVIAVTAQSLEPALRALGADIPPGDPARLDALGALAALRSLVTKANTAASLIGAALPVEESGRRR